MSKQPKKRDPHRPFLMMRLPKELAERLKVAATEIDRPAVWLLRKIVSDYLDSRKK